MRNGQFPATIALGTLNGKNGFKMDGEYPENKSGHLFGYWGVGDVNGDQQDDLAVGALYYGDSRGRIYVVFGGAGIGSSGTITLGSLNGVNGFILDGEYPGDLSGSALGRAGDVNGDGTMDLLIGAPFNNFNFNIDVGCSYVVFGGSNIGAGGPIALGNLDGVNGFKLSGERAGDLSGSAVSGVGDVNKDGYADLLINARGYPSGDNTGRNYLVFGGPRVGLSGHIALGSLNGTTGFILDGEISHHNLAAVNEAGDINGDGYADLLTYDNNYGQHRGRTYVVFGAPTQAWTATPITLKDLNGVNGFKLDGENPGDASGTEDNGFGDINGDHYPDLLIGAYGYPGGNNIGRSYVVFGGENVGSNGTIQLSSLNGTNGFKLDGENTDDCGGFAVSQIGDFNGDGYGDFLIGAFGYNQNTGRSYVVFGGPGVGAEGVIALGNLDGTNGFKLDGENPGDYSGMSVSGVGDINGDNLADLVVNADFFNQNRGRSYVVFGDAPPVITHHHLTLDNGQTVVLNSSQLSAYDRNHPNSSLIFVPSLTHGYFQLSTQPGLPIADFTQQQIWDNAIQFVHDGSSQPPGYNITVKSTGIAWTGPQAAQVTFNSIVFQTPTLTVHQGETVLMSPVNLNVTDTHDASQVNFNITNVQHGQFLLLPLNNSVTQFTQQQVQTGQVLFQQDGSPVTPVYSVMVSDPNATTTPQNAIVIFYRQPTLQLSTLTFHQNQTVSISSGEWNVTDDYPADQVILTINALQHGQFVLSNGTAVMQLTEQQLAASHVTFVHDGSPLPPAYQVIVSDPYMTLPPQEAQVSFYQRPILQPPGLTITQGGNVTINSTAAPVILLNEDYPADQVIFNVTQVKGGYFSIDHVNTSEPIIFTAAQLQAGEISFQQDGSANTPSYELSVKDPYFNLPAVPVTVDFHQKPVFMNNSLSVARHGTLIMSLAQLAVAADVSDDQINFTVVSINNGEFVNNALASHPVITRFNQEQVKEGYIQFYHTAQAGDSIQTEPHYCLEVNDGLFTVRSACTQINYNFSYDPPKIVGMLSNRSYQIGSAINFPLDTNVFAAQNGEALSYSAALSTGDNLPSVGLGFQEDSNIFVGSVGQPGDYNISVTAAGVNENIAATTYFLLQITRPPGSFFTDVKNLGSILGTIGGAIFGGMVYLYGVYYYRRQRQFQHPFANEVHIRLNLSYINFFDHEGRAYKNSITRMSRLLQQQTGVELKQLESSLRRQDKDLYYYFADLFADVICKQVRMRAVYCGLSQELRLNLLEEREQSIVDEIVLHYRRARPERIAAAGRIRWCSFFTDLCCASRRSRRLSLVEEQVEEIELTSLGEQKESKQRQESKESSTQVEVDSPPSVSDLSPQESTSDRSLTNPLLNPYCYWGSEIPLPRQEVDPMDTGKEPEITIHHLVDLR